MARTAKKRDRQRKGCWPIAIVVVVLVLAAGSFLLFFGPGFLGTPSQPKPIIMYVNQGNGIVNGSGFGVMLDYAASRGFNTVFFQVYREGRLLFSNVTLQSFVNQTHEAKLKIFFSLYVTDASQSLPTSIFGLHEDGISLDMSSIPLKAQQSFLAELKAGFAGETAITTTDMNSTLTPGLLVLETYGTGLREYIKGGIVASVGVFATSSIDDYQSQFQYALQNSDGVMVFDYAGLLKAGY